MKVALHLVHTLPSLVSGPGLAHPGLGGAGSTGFFSNAFEAMMTGGPAQVSVSASGDASLIVCDGDEKYAAGSSPVAVLTDATERVPSPVQESTEQTLGFAAGSLLLNQKPLQSAQLIAQPLPPAGYKSLRAVTDAVRGSSPAAGPSRAKPAADRHTKVVQAVPSPLHLQEGTIPPQLITPFAAAAESTGALSPIAETTAGGSTGAVASSVTPQKTPAVAVPVSAAAGSLEPARQHGSVAKGPAIAETTGMWPNTPEGDFREQGMPSAPSSSTAQTIMTSSPSHSPVSAASVKDTGNSADAAAIHSRGATRSSLKPVSAKAVSRGNQESKSQSSLPPSIFSAATGNATPARSAKGNDAKGTTEAVAAVKVTAAGSVSTGPQQAISHTSLTSSSEKETAEFAAHSKEITATLVMQRMDAAVSTGAVPLRADPRHLDVGIASATLGWIEVRATATASGRVDASLHAQSESSAHSLGSQSREITEYVREHSVLMGEVSVGVGTGSGGRQSARSDTPDAQKGSGTADRAVPAVSEGSYRVPETLSLISVRA